MHTRIALLLSLCVLSCEREEEGYAPRPPISFSTPDIVEFTLPNVERVQDPNTNVPIYRLSDGSTALVYCFAGKKFFDQRRSHEHLTPAEQARNQALAEGAFKYLIQDETIENGLKGASYLWINPDSDAISQCKTILYNEIEGYGLEIQMFRVDSLETIDEFLNLFSNIKISNRVPTDGS